MMTMAELAEHAAAALPQGCGRLLAALSGGADSVALLLALCALREERGLQLCAAHVDHGLRGAESDGDAAFVAALCARLRVPLTVTKLTPPENAGETWAREARYDALFRAMAAQGCAALVTAHHADDQAETVLLHLMRGCGPAGACGMAPDGQLMGRRILRPLLGVKRTALREALMQAGETWREDSSNARDDCLRNALRLNILPELERLSPGTGAHLAAFAALQREEQELLCGLEEDFLRGKNVTARYVPLAALQKLHPALRHRVLRRWWQAAAGAQLDRAQTERLDALLGAGTGTALALPGGTAEKGAGYLHHLAETAALPCAPLPEEGSTRLGSVTVSLRKWKPADGTGDGRWTQTLPKSLVRECTLRTRRPGDWLRPFGGGGRRKLQDVLVDRRVDRPFRDVVPLLCRGSEVLLVCGVTAGDLPRRVAEEDRMTLRWGGEMPWAEAERMRGDHNDGTQCEDL